jgi:hypothetical protein
MDGENSRRMESSSIFCQIIKGYGTEIPKQWTIKDILNHRKANILRDT